MSLVEEPDLDRRRTDWEIDEWDEVGEVPAVEPLRQQTRIIKWVVWLSFVLVTVLIIVAGYGEDAVSFGFIDRANVLAFRPHFAAEAIGALAIKIFATVDCFDDVVSGHCCLVR